MYYGKFSPREQEVAVKILSVKSRQGPSEFFNEVRVCVLPFYLQNCSPTDDSKVSVALQIYVVGYKQITLLSKIHHRNLVGLVGYCNDPPDLILLYEYMGGGDLRQRLYG